MEESYRADFSGRVNPPTYSDKSVQGELHNHIFLLTPTRTRIFAVCVAVGLFMAAMGLIIMARGGIGIGVNHGVIKLSYFPLTTNQCLGIIAIGGGVTVVGSGITLGSPLILLIRKPRHSQTEDPTL